MAKDPILQPDVHAVAVIGAGTMGLAIARLLRSSGCNVRVYDERGVTFLEDSGIEASSDLESCVVGADVIFEAIFEHLGAKQALLQEIQDLVGPVPIASNTSTFRPSQLVEGLAYPEAVFVAHFFNPADVVPLVELVPTAKTDPSAIALTRHLLQDAKKTVVTLRREVDGFIANRLQAALIREAAWLVHNDIASVEDVDAAVIHGIGPRWAVAGPFEIMDRGGLDIWQSVTERLFPLLSTDSSTPDALLEHVRRGELGAKSGSGFYSYEADTPSPLSRLGAVLDAASPPDAS